MPDTTPVSAFLSGSGAGPSRFLTTAWTMVVKAQDDDTGVSRRFLGLLVQRYWRPVYHFIRSRGRNHEDAKDLTQGFFTTFLVKDAVSYADQDRGRFRGFLMASVGRYLTGEWRSVAKKPEQRPIANFDSAFHEKCFGQLGSGDPEIEFTRNWLKCLVENSLARLKEECVALGRTAQYEAFRTKYLWEDGGPVPTHDQIAQYLGVTPKDVENLIYRAKKRLRRILREEARNSMMIDGDPDQEIRELLAAVSQ